MQKVTYQVFHSWLILLSLFFIGCVDETGPNDEEPKARQFILSIENISSAAVTPSAFAPGIWVLHQQGNPLFVAGEKDAGLGLEALAEDGSPDQLYSSLEEAYEVAKFDARSDGYDEAAASPGESFTIEFSAKPGEQLSFAAMLIQSNDFFIGTSDEGIPLFDGTQPLVGEVDAIIWNAGTEVDEPLGSGENQPSRQAGPNTGSDEDGVVVDSNLDANQFVKITLALADSE